MELRHHRRFAADLARVFAAHSDPAVLAQWWGPRGFTNQFEVFEFRPGGAWRFTMHGPDGQSYPITKRFVVVDPPQALEILNDQEQHRFTLAIAFAAAPGGATEVSWRMQFPPGSEDPGLRAFLHRANEENLDRLEDYLAGRPPR